MVESLPVMRETCIKPGFDPWVEKIPWRRAWQPTPVFLPGESPWTEEPGGLQSMDSQRVGLNCVTKHTAHFTSRCGHGEYSLGAEPDRKLATFHTDLFRPLRLLTSEKGSPVSAIILLQFNVIL